MEIKAVLDTNFYCLCDTGNIASIALLEDAVSISLPVIVYGELYYGFRHGEHFDKNLKKLEQFIVEFAVSIIQVDVHVARKFGNIFAALYTGVPIHDLSHSFRAKRKDVVDKVRTKSKGNSCFIEFVFRAQKKGYKIGEIPVAFLKRKRGTTKINLGRDSMNALIALLKLRWS